MQLLRAVLFRKESGRRSGYHLLICLCVIVLTSGCVRPIKTALPTLLPTGYLPTAIALTLEASGVGLATVPPRYNPTTIASSMIPSETPEAQNTPAPTFTLAFPPTLEITTEANPITTTQEITVPLPTLTEEPTPVVQVMPTLATPAPEIPNAKIQIYQLGDRSLVTSPIDVSIRLTSQYGKIVRIELWGEDGRLLSRYMRTFDTVPWKSARVGVPLEFEISGAAEEGRLVINVEDPYGRLIDVNSVNLILLSEGVTELNPPTAMLQKIIIQDPAPQALIQGGKLIVSGRALPNLDQPLKLMLVSEDGKVLGQRLAKVEFTEPGNYGTFVAEVPYTVTGLTPALLIVYEDGGQISQIAHLASLQVILAP